MTEISESKLEGRVVNSSSNKTGRKFVTQTANPNTMRPSNCDDIKTEDMCVEY